MLVRELIERANVGWYGKPEEHIALDTWVPGDVFIHASVMDMPEPTQQEADWVIDEIENGLDSDSGITWDTLDFYLRRCDSYTQRNAAYFKSEEDA